MGTTGSWRTNGGLDSSKRSDEGGMPICTGYALGLKIPVMFSETRAARPRLKLRANDSGRYFITLNAETLRPVVAYDFVHCPNTLQIVICPAAEFWICQLMSKYEGNSSSQLLPSTFPGVCQTSLDRSTSLSDMELYFSLWKP